MSVIVVSHERLRPCAPPYQSMLFVYLLFNYAGYLRTLINQLTIVLSKLHPQLLNDDGGLLVTESNIDLPQV